MNGPSPDRWAEAPAAVFGVRDRRRDLTAIVVGLGYFGSNIPFAVVITVPALAYRSLYRQQTRWPPRVRTRRHHRDLDGAHISDAPMSFD
jgi:hypothetical protein